MDRIALAGLLASALAISTASAEPMPPPMDVMDPYDTPAVAADRISMPEDVSTLGAQHAEAGLENAAAAPPEGAGLLDLGAGANAARDATDPLDLAGNGRGDDGDDGDDGNGGNGGNDGGDRDDGDKDDDRDSDNDDDHDDDKGEKPEKEEKPDKDDGDKDDGDG